MKSKVLIGLHGASGRMGQAVMESAGKFSDICISCSYSRSSSEADISRLFESSDIVIDFSSQEATDTLLENALRFKKKLLIGTTGISAEQYKRMQDAAKQIALFYSPNTSICVSLMSSMVKIAASKLPASQYDIDIIDIHHREKLDSPSGTALMFAKSIDEGRGRESVKIFNRAAAGPRQEGDIDFSSIRSGNEPARLEVIFSGASENMSFKHQAYSRSAFAVQALHIAMWLAKMPAGFYTMDDYS